MFQELKEHIVTNLSNMIRISYLSKMIERLESMAYMRTSFLKAYNLWNPA